MLEANQKEHQPADMGPSSLENHRASGLGAFLKAEREKRGLTQDEVVELTRLRRQFVDALEKEEWNSLPAAVFVRGFIRSYARTLELDETEVFNLYDNSVPDESAAPRPLLEPGRARRDWILLLIVVVAVVAAVTYLWQGYLAPRQTAPTYEAQQVAERAVPETALPQEDPAGAEEERRVAEMRLRAQDPRLAALLEGIHRSSAVIEGDLEARFARSLADHEPPAGPGLLPAASSEGLGDTSGDVLSAPPGTELTLEGTVNARTWMRIRIDDQDPREYIFQPGSRPQWKARERFEIRIGNAAGIDFTFNGRKLEKLGKLGEVVRLTLPREAEGRDVED